LSNYQPNFETGLNLDPNLIVKNKALKDLDFAKYKELQNPKLDINLEKELDLKEGELNFGREDSDLEDLDQIDEKISMKPLDTDELIAEMKKELETLENKADSKDSSTKKRENSDETFENLRLYCKNQLNFTFRDVDKMIDSLISRPSEDVSPLLKFYNEIAAHLNFRLPLRSLLEFDTRFFRK